MKNKLKLTKIFDQIKISINKMIEIEDDILKISKLLKNTLRKIRLFFVEMRFCCRLLTCCCRIDRKIFKKKKKIIKRNIIK